MVGGRIGKDGIHGATFSSLTLDESSPVSAVQIGDPITQKNMVDFLLEARDLGLYRFITDNGAGGLSSSLGEMAQASGGVRIDLSACPLKYQGLAPWEILVSESQERMSLAVPPESMAPFLALAARRGVETTEVGIFTDTGFMEILHDGKMVGAVSLAFLHEGNPRMELRAVWKPCRESGGATYRAAGGGLAALPADSDGQALRDLFRRVLSDPVVGSKEDLVRQYDHEVLGQSVIKPFAGVNADAPSDGGMIAPVYGSTRGATVTHGLCPRYGDWDTRDMAMCAVDEAYRAHIAMGGDPDLVSALDNFCWPDPVESPNNPDGPRKLAQLVRACRGLSEACLAYGIPLISGKDSMKNDAKAGGKKISVRPTLLVSLLGIIEDVRRAVSVDFKKPGDPIYLLGETRGELGGTICERLTGRGFGPCPSVKPAEALRLYRALHEAMGRSLVRSCHDLSDGGLAVALAESAFGGDTGAVIDLSPFPAEWEAARVLFCETPSRFLVTVSTEKSVEFEALMAGLQVRKIGEVLDDRELWFDRNGRTLFRCPLDEARVWWRIEW
jgi:phosphoribosylformylglycinamidine synthase